MVNSYGKIIHIPAKPPFSPSHQPTVDVFASVIDPKLANTLVRKLNQITPLENLRHVKRVRKSCFDAILLLFASCKNRFMALISSVGFFNGFAISGKVQLSVILCLTGDNGVDLDSMPMDLQELTNYYQLNPFVTQVCKHAATTKEEWEEQCKLWPTSFHPPTYNIDGITGFNEEDSKMVFNYMNVVLKLSKSANSQFVNAAVIVDPSSNLVITSACDEMSSWNMHLDGNEAHLLDSTEGTKFLDVANQSSLSSNLNGSPCDLETSRNRVSCLNPWQWSQQHSSSPMSCSWNPLRHAAMVAIEYSASRDRHLYPTMEKADEKCCQSDLDAAAVVRSPVKRQKTNLSDVKNDENAPANGFLSKSERPYLCTGYDIYLAWEPCAMCAMALVHQRIRRIFYAFPNPCTGALGSVYRLQGEKSLNHHYAVFQVLMHDEALGSVENARRIDKDDQYNDKR